MLVSGLPDRTEHHAKHAADIAMDMVQAIQKVKITFLKEPLSVKLGMHSGAVVAGIKSNYSGFLLGYFPVFDWMFFNELREEGSTR